MVLGREMLTLSSSLPHLCCLCSFLLMLGWWALVGLTVNASFFWSYSTYGKTLQREVDTELFETTCKEEEILQGQEIRPSLLQHAPWFCSAHQQFCSRERTSGKHRVPLSLVLSFLGCAFPKGYFGACVLSENNALCQVSAWHKILSVPVAFYFSSDEIFKSISFMSPRISLKILITLGFLLMKALGDTSGIFY